MAKSISIVGIIAFVLGCIMIPTASGLLQELEGAVALGFGLMTFALGRILDSLVEIRMALDKNPSS